MPHLPNLLYVSFSVVLTILQVLRHTWLVTTVLYNTTMEHGHNCRKYCWTEPLCSIHHFNVHYHLFMWQEENSVLSTCLPFCNFQIIEFSNVNLFFWLSEVDEISSLVCPPIQWPQSPLFQLCVWIFKNSFFFPFSLPFIWAPSVTSHCCLCVVL